MFVKSRLSKIDDIDVAPAFMVTPPPRLIADAGREPVLNKTNAPLTLAVFVGEE